MVSSRCFRCCCLRVSVLGYTLEGDPAVQHALLGTALRHFPIIGPQLQQNISSIHGSRMGVILASTVPSTGLGVSVALHNAFRGWAWLLYARPNPLRC
jgi:membrane protein